MSRPWTSVVAAGLAAAAFGPYLVGGLRTEQAAVYGTLLVLAPLYLVFLRAPRHAVALLALWGIYGWVALVGAVAPPMNMSGYVAGSVFAGIDNALLPLAVLLVTGMLLVRGDPGRILRAVTVVVAVGMCVNAVIGILQVGGLGIPELWAVSGETTAERAASNGRYSGLINQPSEAGTLYGIAMLCALYRIGHRPVLVTSALALLFAGGLLTVSKVFLLAAIPVVVWQMFTKRGRGSRMLALVVLAGAGWAAIQSGSLPTWTGADTLRRVLPRGSEDWVTAFGSNRYGAESTLAPIAEAVLDGPALFGYGAGGLGVAYDSQWLESLVVAGVAGLLLVVIIGCVLAHRWRTMPRSAVRSLYGGSLLIVAASSLGLPSLTANRVATIFWLVAALVVFRGSDDLGELEAGYPADRLASLPSDAEVPRGGAGKRGHGPRSRARVSS